MCFLMIFHTEVGSVWHKSLHEFKVHGELPDPKGENGNFREISKQTTSFPFSCRLSLVTG